MYVPILSVLLMGMIPVLDVSGGEAIVGRLAVASPSPLSVEQVTSTGLGYSLSASGVVVIDLLSGQEVYARNATLRRPMGSLTKLMTALLIVEHHGLDEEVTVPKGIRSVPGSKANLAPGSRFTVGDLLTALLVASANDAAHTLAVYHSGSEADFVRAMNARARTLGLRDTAFANPAGLDAATQWSTPRDIAWLSLYVLRSPSIRERMSLSEVVIRDTDGRALTLTHTHQLLHEDSPVVAGKTGTTAAAKQCLLSIVREGGREYAVVLLGSRERYADMQSVLRSFRELFI